ncbi:hypothetical protein CRE_26807 [Caenorhabditis remanei]|uniref:Uncharacterized protein n=1 Tax=Caenorhabditis remanei TaxID=31234 RepID=E3NGC3_CAERE|nr:hypothetical protein CRE_26807 [Caenorhabditis remanei]
MDADRLLQKCDENGTESLVRALLNKNEEIYKIVKKYEMLKMGQKENQKTVETADKKKKDKNRRWKKRYQLSQGIKSRVSFDKNDQKVVQYVAEVFKKEREEYVTSSGATSGRANNR